MSIEASAAPIETPTPDLRGAGVGRRFLATLVDGIVFFVVVLGFFAVWGESGGCDSAFNLTITSGDDTNSVCGAPAGFYGLLIFGYYVVLEKLFGATLGKLLLGLRVRSLADEPVSWGAAIIRTILRVIDGILVYLVAAIAVWSSARNQRLGDMAAKTLVLRR